MTYFAKFPIIQYNFTTQTDSVPIVDIINDLSTRIRMSISDADFQNLCQRYTIGTNELPEHISYKFYGTPDLAWTIIYINGIMNLNNDWPLSDRALNEYVITKYGAGNVNNVHHYEKMPEGVTMDYQFIVNNYGSSAVNIVTNANHEDDVNNDKRYIYIIKPENIVTFVQQYMALLG